MKIVKIDSENNSEQKENSELFSTENLIENIKELFLNQKDSNFKNNISSIKNNIESLKNEIDKKNILIQKSNELKKEFNKKIQKIELDIYSKREKMLSELENK